MQPPEPFRPSRLAAAVLALAFSAGVAAPLSRWIVTGERDRSALDEQRDPAPPPELAAHRLVEWPELTAAWFADAFPFRRDLVRLHNLAIWFGLGTSPADVMLRGADDWLFYRGEGTFATYRGELLSEAELAAWVERYLAWRDWLAARDVQWVMTIAPEKQGVYADPLPAWVGQPAERTRTDQFVEALAERGGRVIDTRAALRAQAERELVYYPLGTHWNDAGAYVGYELLVAELGSTLAVGGPRPREAFERRDNSVEVPGWYGDSWTERMHIADLVGQPDNNLVPREPTYVPTAIWPGAPGSFDGVVVNQRQDLPTAVLLCDSFGAWFWPFLGHHFARLVSESRTRFDVELVERELPDVVLQLRVERFLVRDLTPAGFDPHEVEVARAWNAGAPVEVEGERLAGRGSAALRLRAVRPRVALPLELPRPAWPALEPAARELALVDANGVRHRVRFEFGAGRRVAFAGPIQVELPARFEPFEGGALPPFAFAARRAVAP